MFIGSAEKDGRKLGLSPLRCNTRCQPSYQREAPPHGISVIVFAFTAPGIQGWVHLQRNPNVSRVRLNATKAARRHTDNREWVAFDKNRLADNGAIARKSPVPEAITKDGRGSVILLIIKTEHTAAGGTYSQP